MDILKKYNKDAANENDSRVELFKSLDTDKIVYKNKYGILITLNNENLETINPFNKNGTWSTQNMYNLDELPKASSTAKEDTNSKRSFMAINDPNEQNRKG